MPINAVQFTILSIIAMGYKPAVAPYGSEVSPILLPISKNATIDKTLFYGVTNLFMQCGGALWGSIGKPVKLRYGPAAVFGDEIRNCH
jgi:hypothetical protein